MSAVTKADLHRLIDELDDRRLPTAQRALAVLRGGDQTGPHAATAPPAVEMPPAVAERLAFLDALDDAALWQAAHTRVAQQDGERMADLNDKAQREGLTAAEVDEQTALIDRCEDVMLIRARATFMLKQRGYDIHDLLPR